MKILTVAIIFATNIYFSNTNPGIVGANETKHHQHIRKIVPKKSTPAPLKAGIRWNTKSTDKKAYWPTTASSLASIPTSAQKTFACIRYNESRNHLDSISYEFAGGLYQFLDYIWAHYGGLKYASKAQYASGIEQDAVAVNVYKANKGFLPEWAGDNQCF